MQKNTRLKQTGSSLVAMAFMIVVLGFLMTGGIYLYQNYNTIYSDQESVDKTQDIQTALLDYAKRTGRLPLPAPLSAAPDTAQFGVEQTSVVAGVYRAQGRDGADVRIGTVPTRTLNIDDSMMFDGYHKRYIYAVTESLTAAGADVFNDPGAITITDHNGETVSKIAGFVNFALISLGEDERGAFNEEGILIEPCATSGDAANNCDFLTAGTPDATFIATLERSFETGNDSYTHNFAFMANEPPYKWQVNPWSECAGVCFTGTQSRSVLCVDHANNTVSDNNCNHTPKPQDGERDCSLPPCKWRPRSWENCQSSQACI